MSFTIDITAEYPIHNVIPPRCRNPRTVYETLQTKVKVAEVSESDAPVAFRYVNPIQGLQERRWHDGKLYAPYLPFAHQSEPSIPGSKHFLAERTYGAHQLSSVDGRAEAEQWVQQAFDHYLIIDGVVWRECGEPVYVVMTFGLGNNHGGTGLMVDEIMDGYTNPNIVRRAYWNANEHAQAREMAIRVATARGDDQSIPRFDDMTYNIEVLIDEAVRFKHVDEN